ncbi:MAG TPA: choice-of-anchor L domain-containing protein, partial [Bacteroidales bacterium]|nr:choice-of-anchor L domain-containing protein [Bacteroidales bacterium]
MNSRFLLLAVGNNKLKNTVKMIDGIFPGLQERTGTTQFQLNNQKVAKKTFRSLRLIPVMNQFVGLSAKMLILVLFGLSTTLYSQESHKSLPQGVLLKERYPRELSNPKSQLRLSGGNGPGDSYAGSISVNEDPAYTSLTPDQLVQQAFITGCLTASNVKFGYYRQINSNWVWFNHSWGSLENRQMGYFQRATSNFPINEGIILTTGTTSSAMGPNNTGSMSQFMVYGANDPDLMTISGQTMNDAAVLEFDFVPAGNTMEFKYIFSSEEYLEYVNTA